MENFIPMISTDKAHNNSMRILWQQQNLTNKRKKELESTFRQIQTIKKATGPKNRVSNIIIFSNSMPIISSTVKGEKQIKSSNRCLTS